MISVIVPTRNSAADLQVLLPRLVPAAMDGLVRDVIAADAGSTDATLEICEDAGVRVTAGGIVGAAASARGPRLLILPASLALRPGWDDRLRAHLGEGGGAAVLRGARSAGLAGLMRPRGAGLLIDRGGLTGQPETRDVAGLVRALGRGARRL